MQVASAERSSRTAPSLASLGKPQPRLGQPPERTRRCRSTAASSPGPSCAPKMLSVGASSTPSVRRAQASTGSYSCSRVGSGTS